MTHDPSPVYLFDPWLTNDTVCIACFFLPPPRRQNKNQQVLRGESKELQTTQRNGKHVFFVFCLYWLVPCTQGFPRRRRRLFLCLWRAICIPAARVRTIKPFPLQSISLQPAIQARPHINGQVQLCGPCVPGNEEKIGVKTPTGPQIDSIPELAAQAGRQLLLLGRKKSGEQSSCRHVQTH